MKKSDHIKSTYLYPPPLQTSPIWEPLNKALNYDLRKACLTRILLYQTSIFEWFVVRWGAYNEVTVEDPQYDNKYDIDMSSKNN